MQRYFPGRRTSIRSSDSFDVQLGARVLTPL